MGRDGRRLRDAERRLWESVGLAPRERFVTIRTGESVRIQEVGDGPPLLFVHGAANTGSSWAALLPHLDGFRCLLLDRPNCGLSDPIAGPVGTIDAFRDHADDLAADVLDALAIERAPVVATSLGGYFAIRGAAAHPDRIERVVEFSWTIGAPMASVPLAMRLTALPGLGPLVARLPPPRPAVRSILRQVGLGRALDNGRFTPEMFEVFLATLRDTPTLPNETRSNPKAITPLAGQNQRLLFSDDLLARVTAPALFVWGAEDPNGGPDIARDLVARFPDATLHVLDEAGHAPWIDEPETCAALAGAFLRGDAAR